MKLYFLLFFVFMTSYFTSISQSKVNALQHLLFFKPGISVHSYRENELQYHNGFIIKNSGDTLWGYIRLAGQKDQSVSYKKDLFQKETSNYDFLLIKKVRLFSSDTTLLNTHYTDFDKVPGMGSNLFRKLFEGKIILYDDYLLSGENNGLADLDGMVIKKGDKAEYVSSFWTTSSKKALFKKINLYSGTKLKKSQFADIPSLLKWMRNYLS